MPLDQSGHHKKARKGSSGWLEKNIIITSGCRTPAQQAALSRGSSGGSHTRGDAIDSVPAGGGCEPYKQAVEQVNKETYLPCNHGTGPHLHLDLRNGPPPKDKDPSEYKRQDQAQDSGSPAAGGGSPAGGGGSPGAGGEPRSPSFEQPATESSITKAFEPSNRASGTSRIGNQDFKGEDTKNIQGLIKDGKQLDPVSAITNRDAFGIGHAGGMAPTLDNGKSLNGVEAQKIGAFAIAKASSSEASPLSPRSYGESAGGAREPNSVDSKGKPAKGNGSSFGSSGEESTNTFSKPLGDPKFSLKNSEIGPAALAEKIGIDVSIREPEAKQEDGVEQESLFYRIRGAYYRCEQRGCILFGGAR